MRIVHLHLGRAVEWLPALYSCAERPSIVSQPEYCAYNYALPVPADPPRAQGSILITGSPMLARFHESLP